MTTAKTFSAIFSLPLVMALCWYGHAGESRTGSALSMDAESVTEGTWGGDRIALEVTDKGARLDYDCAHGTIEHKLVTDDAGRFQGKGFHFRERGGPQHEEDDEKGEAATYTGRTDGKNMTLTVTLAESKETVGTFKLKHGTTGRVMKCK